MLQRSSRQSSKPNTYMQKVEPEIAARRSKVSKSTGVFNFRRYHTSSTRIDFAESNEWGKRALNSWMLCLALLCHPN